MNAVFADTSFYVAFANPKDRWHETAVAAGTQWRGSILTTKYVLVEVGNHLSAPANRPIFLRMATMIQRDEKTQLVASTSRLLQAGLKLFDSRPDKGWSLTDCISFVVMDAYSVTQVLTCDHHFAQAGFHVLLHR